MAERKVQKKMLNWKWENKIGVLEYTTCNGKKLNINIYRGNALMIFLHEYEENGENLYEMFTFFCDKQHLKNIIQYEETYFKNWNKIKIWDIDEKTFQALKMLYKKGIDIEMINIPF